MDTPEKYNRIVARTIVIMVIVLVLLVALLVFTGLKKSYADGTIEAMYCKQSGGKWINVSTNYTLNYCSYKNGVNSSYQDLSKLINSTE